MVGDLEQSKPVVVSRAQNEGGGVLADAIFACVLKRGQEWSTAGTLDDHGRYVMLKTRYRVQPDITARDNVGPPRKKRKGNGADDVAEQASILQRSSGEVYPSEIMAWSA